MAELARVKSQNQKGGKIMPGKKISEMSIEELEKKYGVKAQKGKISKDGGKYYLSVEGKKTELEPNMIISSKPIERLMRERTEVYVISSPKQRIPIVLWPYKPPFGPPVLCYMYGGPELFKIDFQLRTQLVRTLIKQKVLPEAIGKQLISDIAAEIKS